MAIVGSMHWLLEGDHLSNLLNVVLVIATGVVVWFAWRTVTEAKRATDEERKTVTELKQLVLAAQETAEQQKAAAGHLDQLAATAKDTAASSANAVEAAKLTVELAIEAAKAADQQAAAAAERASPRFAPWPSGRSKT
jgi:cytoskeletal protein RodZ